jgi:hypothetical protein
VSIEVDLCLEMKSETDVISLIEITLSRIHAFNGFKVVHFSIQYHHRPGEMIIGPQESVKRASCRTQY